MKQTRGTTLISIISALIALFGLHACNALVTPERSFRSPPPHLFEKSSCSTSNFDVSSAVIQRMPYSSSLASYKEITEITEGYNCSRRSSLFAMIGAGAGTATLIALPLSRQAAAAADNVIIEDEAAQKAAAKERMAQRIAESKLKYRKPTDLVIERKENTDYSCVSTTGSPCPEGLVPVEIQRELIGVLQKKM
jgi:hypothetical protein